MPTNLSLNLMEFENNLLCVEEVKVLKYIGIRYILKFDNNYGASIVKSYGTKGFEDDKWELAVILFYRNKGIYKFTNLDYYEIVYPYEIVHNRDTLGYLDNEDIIKILRKISKLDKFA